jgi:hypothetical protein
MTQRNIHLRQLGLCNIHKFLPTGKAICDKSLIIYEKGDLFKLGFETVHGKNRSQPSLALTFCRGA